MPWVPLAIGAAAYVGGKVGQGVATGELDTGYGTYTQEEGAYGRRSAGPGPEPPYIAAIRKKPAALRTPDEQNILANWDASAGVRATQRTAQAAWKPGLPAWGKTAASKWSPNQRLWASPEVQGGRAMQAGTRTAQVEALGMLKTRAAGQALISQRQAAVAQQQEQARLAGTIATYGRGDAAQRRLAQQQSAGHQQATAGASAVAAAQEIQAAQTAYQGAATSQRAQDLALLQQEMAYRKAMEDQAWQAESTYAGMSLQDQWDRRKALQDYETAAQQEMARTDQARWDREYEKYLAKMGMFGDVSKFGAGMVQSYVGGGEGGGGGGGKGYVMSRGSRLYLRP